VAFVKRAPHLLRNPLELTWIARRFQLSALSFRPDLTADCRQLRAIGRQSKCAPGLVLALAIAFCGANVAFAQEAVFVVRHAERANQSADAPLSAAGAARALKLAAMLKDAGITHIYTTTLKRTIETAAPLAAAISVRAEQLPTADTKELAARLAALGPHDRALVVGHSNTVPGLIRALHSDTRIAISDKEYDNLFIVVPQKNAPPTLLRLKY
jgi:phosphohistidine phosphatase SixA